MQPTLKLLDQPTRYMFFTGKGGVGKTSVSTAVSLALAEAGKKVLLVSTDAASNLDEMLGVELSNQPVAVPHVPGMFVLNIDPGTAAIDYRARVIEQMGDHARDEDIALVREQLSGACTTEIATFDEFSHLLSQGSAAYDHIVFDTAPTGHTLRLLSLPKAWSGFLKGNDRGASCLGPHSGLKMQEQLFNQALVALNDPALTTVVLVTRPDKGALSEAARSSDELRELGLNHQRLVVNAVFKRSDLNDPIAAAIEAMGQQALDEMPASLRQLSADYIPLKAVDSVGLPALRALLTPELAVPASIANPVPSRLEYPALAELIAELAHDQRGLIMVMGKGGVGKTTIAAAIALGLVQHGKSVHLSTTDPAAHLAVTLNADVQGLSVGRIDPKVETQKYVDKIVASRAPSLTEDETALLIEDLQSPCTEEVAVFHAFSRVVAQARSAFVVLDTAPTGHSLLLMDATGAYHRQMVREFKGKASDHIVTPLMRLQDADYTKIILVTLPEATPVSQAAALQEDLRRADIEPFAWVVNKSLLATDTTDPLLRARLDSERKQMARVAEETNHAVIVVPWTAEPPVGVAGLKRLLD
ncbi:MULTISPECIES: arsenical pump-driving ATPase [unclassified Pseudomonas]|jgi:arsenite/tail-anchored protein-transporting ATPase|uniref:arsenical pump-driving ATPase n=1 Tax=unclassified Pseudomonas TaxID=196821 RepID=UPI000C878518|nr:MULTISPECIES: arsenical pump-driving ATPase [unclassified Pseudomonas]PMU86796.1 arsenical pump-driving ATPase [Pseudomonas sp. GW704-F3]PMU90836.1 arsenical pump-driving ATPase [Pseudomonas sp. GW704-F5]PMV00722.1 arsenical pump-driving ATPase [Pseudomonas sp. MPBD4-3]PMV25152.1 arsenical pump-driving ATPase [Pseudomonas sp. GW704-F2]